MASPRRPSLTDVVGPRRSLLAQEPEPQPVETPRAQAESIAQPRPPSRQGKKAVAFWLRPEAHKQLRQLSLKMDRPLQDLMEEAADDLFAKYGLHRIAKE